MRLIINMWMWSEEGGVREHQGGNQRVEGADGRETDEKFSTDTKERYSMKVP